MHLLSRRRACALGVALLAAAPAILVLRGRLAVAPAVFVLRGRLAGPALPLCTLRDGTVLKVEGVTFGTRHKLPKGVGTGPYFGTSLSSTMLWISHRDATGKRLLPMPSYGSAVFDEHGCGLIGATGGGFGPWWDQSGFGYGYCKLNCTPPPGKPLRLRFYKGYRSDDEVVGDMDLPGTLFAGRERRLVPERLPASCRMGDVSITLASVDTAQNGRRESAAPSVTVQVQVACGGKPDPHWEPIASETAILGASGSTCPVQSLLQLSDGSWQFDADGICLREPAWRLEMRMAPTADAPARPDERRVVRGIPVPTQGNPRALPKPLTATLQGVKLNLLEVAWAESDLRSEYWPNTIVLSNRMMRRPNVLLALSGLQEDQRLTCRAFDDRGRLVADSGSGIGADDRAYALAPAAGARTLDLEFTVHRTYKVAFTFRPPASDTLAP